MVSDSGSRCRVGASTELERNVEGRVSNLARRRRLGVAETALPDEDEGRE